MFMSFWKFATLEKEMGTSYMGYSNFPQMGKEYQIDDLPAILIVGKNPHSTRLWLFQARYSRISRRFILSGHYCSVVPYLELEA